MGFAMRMLLNLLKIFPLCIVFCVTGVYALFVGLVLKQGIIEFIESGPGSALLRAIDWFSWDDGYDVSGVD